MWRHLRLRGLGVIAEAELDFGPGFTVITGETGAGKTMVVTALGLLRGERADAGLVRHGDATARVEAELETSAPIEELVSEHGGESEDGVVLMARAVSAQGRSRAYLGGAAVPVGVLSRVSEHAVAVHGQADQYRLLRPAAQREALDAFAQNTEALEAYQAAYEAYRTLRDRLAAIRSSTQERARELDQLRFGLDEIDAVAPIAGEDEALGAESARLANAEGLVRAAREAHGHIAGGDDAVGGAAASLAQAAEALETAQSLDADLAPLIERLREASYVVGDVGAELIDYLGGLDLDPARIETVEARRADLNRLTRKYGATLTEVLEWADDARERVAALDLDDAQLTDLAADVDAAARTAVERAGLLSERRAAAAVRLGAAVEAELGELALPHARLVVEVASPAEPGPDDLAAEGFDTVEFAFTANAGTALRPLAKGASGGELSRVMLALEVVLVDTRRVPTLVFDEVDAGIGGKAAVEVGRRLARLAEHAQVFAVTHLPQVAAFADHHFHVEKSHDGSVTASSVLELRDTARVEELSRMLAGQDDSDSAQAHARELLDLAVRRSPRR